MLKAPNKKPIPVGILEISAQNKAILEYFFSSSGKAYFKEVGTNNASVFIIDYDSPGAKNSWESTFNKTKKPGIIISIKEVVLPSTIWIAKPLTVKALMDASISIREMILQEEAKPTPVTPTLKKEIKPLEEAAPDIIQFDALLDSKIKDKEPVASTQEVTSNVQAQEPELAVVETRPAMPSTTNFAISPDLIDIDLSLDKQSFKVAKTEEKIESITLKGPLDEPEIAKANSSSHEDDVDFLLTSLASNEEDKEKAVESSTEPSFKNNTDIGLIDSDLKSTETNKSKDNQGNTGFVDINLEAPILESSQLDNKAEFELVTTTTNELSAKEAIAPIDFQEVNETPIDIAISNENSIEDNINKQVENNLKINSDEHLKQSQDKNTIGIPKKTAEEELQALLDEIREEADSSSQNSSSSSSSSSSSKHISSTAEERWKLTCGESEDTDKLTTLCSFSPNVHMLASLLKTIKISKKSGHVSRLKFKGVIIVIDPKTDSIYCDLSIFTEIYANICYEAISKESIKIHKLDTSEIRLYRKKMEIESKNKHTFESFIWTTSLLTSRGRLPKDTNINGKVSLKYWPNLTRLEKIPHTMQIAAVFHKNEGSLAEIPRELAIPQKYVIAFYNAALSLEIIEIDESKSSSLPMDLNKKVNKNRGFFSRLLKKVTS